MPLARDQGLSTLVLQALCLIMQHRVTAGWRAANPKGRDCCHKVMLWPSDSIPFTAPLDRRRVTNRSEGKNPGSQVEAGTKTVNSLLLEEEFCDRDLLNLQQSPCS